MRSSTEAMIPCVTFDVSERCTSGEVGALHEPLSVRLKALYFGGNLSCTWGEEVVLRGKKYCTSGERSLYFEGRNIVLRGKTEFHKLCETAGFRGFFACPMFFNSSLYSTTEGVLLL